jgi:hypothetical protein
MGSRATTNFQQNFLARPTRIAKCAAPGSRGGCPHGLGQTAPGPCLVLFIAFWRRTLPFPRREILGRRKSRCCGAIYAGPRQSEWSGQFPATRWSLIVAARSAAPEERRRALEVLIAAYWKPVYNYIRLRWDKDNEHARDLTQDFFFHLLERDLLATYDPHRARLRTFLRVCIDHLIAHEDKAARRLKRGGAVQFLPLDFESAEGELQHIKIPSPESLEDFFEREWVRSVFTLSLETLRQECEQRGKQLHFRLLEFYDIEVKRQRKMRNRGTDQ